MNRLTPLAAIALLSWLCHGRGAAADDQLEEARRLYNSGKYAQVEEALSGALQQKTPSAEALNLSLQAAIADGRYLAAEKRVAALLERREKEDTELLYLAGKVARWAGEESKALDRFRLYAKSKTDKSPALEKAYAFCFERGAYPDLVKAYTRLYGASDKSWTIARQSLAELIAMKDGASALDLAAWMMKTFSDPKQVTHVHGLLKRGADGFAFGGGADQYGKPLALMIQTAPSSYGCFENVADQAQPDPDAYFTIMQTTGKPFSSGLLDDLRNRIRQEKGQKLRLQYGKRVMDLIAIYGKSKDPSDLLDYMTIMADLPDALRIQGQEVLEDPMAVKIYNALADRYKDDPGQLRALSNRWIEHYVENKETRLEFIRSNITSVYPKWVALLLEEQDAINPLPLIKQAAGGNESTELWFRRDLMPYLEKAGLTSELVATARERMLLYPGSFDVDRMHKDFMASKAVPMAQKISVLKEFSAKAGYGARLDELLKRCDKDGAIKNAPDYKSFRNSLDKKTQGSDPLLAAHATIHAIKRNRSNPSKEVYDAAALALQGYPGKIPDERDWRRSRTAEDVFESHKENVWDKREEVYKWAALWAPHLGQSDRWNDMLRRVREHRGDDELRALAPHYLALIQNGWDGTEKAWNELTNLLMPEGSQDSVLRPYYSKIRPEWVTNHIRRNERRWDSATILKQVDAFLAAPEYTPGWDLGTEEHLLRLAANHARKLGKNNAPLSPSLIHNIMQFYLSNPNSSDEARRLAMQVCAQAGKGSAALQACRKSLSKQSPASSFTTLSDLLETGKHQILVEKNIAKPVPDAQIGIILNTLKPLFDQIPEDDFTDVQVFGIILERCKTVMQQGSGEPAKQATAFYLKLGQALANGAGYSGSGAVGAEALHATLQEAYKQNDRALGSRSSQAMTDFIRRINNWDHAWRNHIEPISELLKQAKAWEPLYRFTTTLLEQDAPQSISARLSIAKAEAAQHVGGGVYPVDPKDPTYPLYVAASERAQGNTRKAWDLTRPNIGVLKTAWIKLDKEYVAWVAEQLRLQKQHDQAMELCMHVLLKEFEIPAETVARILLTKADIYRDQRNFEAARIEYTGLKDNQRYNATPAGSQAKYRLVDLLIAMGGYDSADQILERWQSHSDPVVRTQAHFYLAKIAFEQKEYDRVRDELSNVFALQHDHTEARLLEGEWKILTGRNLDNPEIPIGEEGQRNLITPGRALTLDLQDRNLAVVQGGKAIPVLVKTDPGGDQEVVKLFPDSGNPNLFRAAVPTGLGKATPGNSRIELKGNDTLSYAIDPEYRKANNLPDCAPKQMQVADDAYLAASAGRILSEKEQEELELSRQTQQLQGRAFERGRSTQTVRPGSPIYLQVRDFDRDTSDRPDTVHVNLKTSSGDILDGVVLTETAPHAGLFQGQVKTGTPAPRAAASDSGLQSDPSVLINSTRNGEWVSQSDGKQGKWVEVDTMSSHVISSAILEMPSPGSVTAITLRGMLEDEWTDLGRYPDANESIRGGVFAYHLEDRHQEREPSAMRQIIRQAEAPGTWQPSPHFNRQQTPAGNTHNRWMISRLRGAFYLSEASTLELKFIHTPSPGSWQYAYVVIDGKTVLGGPVTRNTIAKTGMIALDKGGHRYELLVRGHWKQSSVTVGYRQNDGNYAPLPQDWFDTKKQPSLQDFLKPQATLQRRADGFHAALRTGQRLRRLRWVFHAYSGSSVKATKMRVTTADGKTVIPVPVDFTSAIQNDVLEISPGDRIDVSYSDERNSSGEVAVLNRNLNARYYDGEISINYEELIERPNGMDSVFRKAHRYRKGDTLMVIVQEHDADLTANADRLPVRVETSSGQRLELTALEADLSAARDTGHRIHSGEFRALLKTGDKTGEDTIAVKPGDRITVRYLDKENTRPGIPAMREAGVISAENGAPRVRVYATQVAMVEDTSEQAKNRLALLKSRGRDVEGLTFYRKEIVAEAPDASPDNDLRRISMNAPMMVEVAYPAMALNESSTITVHAVPESELKAAEAAERDPAVLAIPLSLRDIESAARDKGYRHLRVRGATRRRKEELLEEGLFSGVIRLQIGNPGDPVNDLVETGVNPFAVDDPQQVGQANRIPTLLVTGADTVHLRIASEAGDTIAETRVALVSKGRLELLDRSYDAAKTAIHLGDRFYIQLTDPDQDATDANDTVEIDVKTEPGGEQLTLTLTETLPHSGVFTSTLLPVFAGTDTLSTPKDVSSATSPMLRAGFGESVVFTYRDNLTFKPGTVESVIAKGRIHHGADASVVAFSKRFADPEMAVKVRFLMAEALFEMAKDYRDLGNTDKTAESIAEGKRILTEALRDFPHTKLVGQGEYLLANLAQELATEEKDPARQRALYEEAIGKYAKILSTWPNSEHAAPSQLKKAICLHRLEEYDRASEEYVKLIYTYPDSPLVSDATVRLGNHYYKVGRYQIAGKIFASFQRNHETHPLAAKVLFLAAQCFMKQAQAASTNSDGTPIQRRSLDAVEHYNEAIEMLKRLSDQYEGDNSLVPKAQYWIGDCYYKIGDYRNAYITFKKLTFDYPRTEEAKRALGYLTDEKLDAVAE